MGARLSSKRGGCLAAIAIASVVFAPAIASAAAAPPAPPAPPAAAAASRDRAGDAKDAPRHGRTAHVDATSSRRGEPSMGRSVGSPTEGHLIGGAHLAEAPYLRVVPTYANDDARWGLGSLVSLLDRAARAVRRAYPDAIMSVGDLSRAGGGEVERHASHESGRDADVGFYVTNAQGKAIYAEHFVAFRGDGTAPSWPGARFDDARNWALVAALVGDGRARVTHLFVAAPLRARLLAWAQKIGAPHEVRVRAAEVMAQPRGSLPHDDHFHVRIACPAGMQGCIEYPTVTLPRDAIARARRRFGRDGARGAHGSRVARVGGEARAEAAGSGAEATRTAASPATPPRARRSRVHADPNADAPAIPAPTEDPPSMALPTPFEPPAAAGPTLDDEGPPADDAPIDDVDGPLPTPLPSGE